MELSVYIPNTPTKSELNYLSNHLSGITALLTGKNTPDVFHVLVTGRPTREQLETSTSLHTLIIPFAGLPADTRELMKNYPHIKIYNSHHNAIATGEMALTLMFACARLIIPADKSFRKQDWSSRYQPSPQIILNQKNALILGYGSIAKSITPALKALGMNVTGIRRSKNNPEKNIYTPEYLHQLLPHTHILIVTLPATDETTGIINKKEFELLPKGAIVINVGRAQVIDQHAFYNALKTKHLHAGASDVWYHYPSSEKPNSKINTHPADAPFHELNNIVMSPHRAGAFGNHDVEKARYAFIANLINLIADNKNNPQLPPPVCLETGY